MRHRTLKLGLVAATALAAALPLLASQPAFADYAPNSSDVVGVGSDTLQYMLDFTADGFAASGGGYNGLGNKYKLDNIDATADANARLAYGSGGAAGATVGSTTGECAPGTGSNAGTGTATSPHTGNLPCVLNPTVVLRQGTDPVQRPNGGGAGLVALQNDINAGNTGGTGNTTGEQIN